MHKICIVGGTGAEGSGLGLRWANAGHDVIIASRSIDKAAASAKELNESLGSAKIKGDDTASGIDRSDIIVLTVPYAAQVQTIVPHKDRLNGKIVIDVTVPLVPPKVSRVQLPEKDSCVVALQEALGPAVRVVSAFQNVSAHKLKNLSYEIACDVLVTGDDPQARALAIGLAKDAGLRGIDAGPLANSTVAESLTSALIHINRFYKIPDAGIRITGIPTQD